MAYTKPFTLAQKRQAARAYRSFRRNLRLFRSKYAPRNEVERTVLKKYQEAVKLFGLEAARPIAWVNANMLNLLDEAAQIAMYQYLFRRRM